MTYWRSRSTVANMKLSIVSYKRRKCVYVGSLESSQLGQSNEDNNTKAKMKKFKYSFESKHMVPQRLIKTNMHK